MPAPAAPTATLGAIRRPPARPRASRIVAPILVRQLRNGIEESVHRGDIVEVDAAGRILRQLGDPDRLVTLRSTVKPFGLVALIEAGGIAAFDLEPAELAILASSHSGEDLHVRTLQAIYRRTGVSQSLLACGSEGMPLDALTAARLARDGEKAGPIRHMCSGQHTVFAPAVPAPRLGPDRLLAADAPVAGRVPRGGRPGVRHDAGEAADRRSTAAASRRTPSRLREVARAYAMLADPDGDPGRRPARRAAPRRSRSSATRCSPTPR